MICHMYRNPQIMDEKNYMPTNACQYMESYIIQHMYVQPNTITLKRYCIILVYP